MRTVKLKMYKIKLSKFIQQVTDLFYKLNFWQKEKTVLRKIKSLFFLLFFSVGLFITCLLGSIFNDDKEDSLFLLAATFTTGVVVVKGFYSYSKQEESLFFLREICVHSITNKEEFQQTTEKLNNFKKFAIFSVTFTFIAVTALSASALPALTPVKRLPFNVWVLLNTSSVILYWTIYAYMTIALYYNTLVFVSTVLFWYLMLNCSIAYEVLGNRLKNLGVVAKKTFVISELTNDLFQRDLLECIKTHLKIKKNIERLKYVFSNLLFIQITTSSLSICGSIYALVFSWSEQLIKNIFFSAYLVYNLFDIFIYVYLGNEIKLASNRLRYCLFQSNWNEQSESNKKIVMILMEVLKQPQVLIVGKVYPLTLETFTGIINLSYSMFNLLKST